MHTEFRKANIPADLRRLMAFDRQTFEAADRFDAAYWKTLDSFWMLVNGERVGCCAFERDVDFQEDVHPSRENLPMPGSIYIASTAILPRMRGKGYGLLFKTWQLTYARTNGFNRIVTNVRGRNRAIIALNKKVGFQRIRTTRGYYQEPTDSTVVMELRLEKPRT